MWHREKEGRSPPPAFVYHYEQLQLQVEIPLHHLGPPLTPRMCFPVSADVKPAEAQTAGSSPFDPSADHFHGHPNLWR
ncbi:hypothetical protein L3Q82_026323 [Scortum barcoo]|uniref:Uncharacterized protein n=1 Tax=Scortum barcoo TaxID=214431 RepID=A0ACB8WIG6_9TELE|nr:hypothetical protein L3Q82_026323 [Scortum barcoo]